MAASARDRLLSSTMLLWLLSGTAVVTAAAAEAAGVVPEAAALAATSMEASEDKAAVETVTASVVTAEAVTEAARATAASTETTRASTAEAEATAASTAIASAEASSQMTEAEAARAAAPAGFALASDAAVGSPVACSAAERACLAQRRLLDPASALCLPLHAPCGEGDAQGRLVVSRPALEGDPPRLQAVCLRARDLCPAVDHSYMWPLRACLSPPEFDVACGGASPTLNMHGEWECWQLARRGGGGGGGGGDGLCVVPDLWRPLPEPSALGDSNARADHAPDLLAATPAQTGSAPGGASQAGPSTEAAPVSTYNTPSTSESPSTQADSSPDNKEQNNDQLLSTLAVPLLPDSTLASLSAASTTIPQPGFSSNLDNSELICNNPPCSHTVVIFPSTTSATPQQLHSNAPATLATSGTTERTPLEVQKQNAFLQVQQVQTTLDEKLSENLPVVSTGRSTGQSLIQEQQRCTSAPCVEVSPTLSIPSLPTDIDISSLLLPPSPVVPLQPVGGNLAENSFFPQFGGSSILTPSVQNGILQSTISPSETTEQPTQNHAEGTQVTQQLGNNSALAGLDENGGLQTTVSSPVNIEQTAQNSVGNIQVNPFQDRSSLTPSVQFSISQTTNEQPSQNNVGDTLVIPQIGDNSNLAPSVQYGILQSSDSSVPSEQTRQNNAGDIQIIPQSGDSSIPQFGVFQPLFPPQFNVQNSNTAVTPSEVSIQPQTSSTHLPNAFPQNPAEVRSISHSPDDQALLNSSLTPAQNDLVVQYVTLGQSNLPVNTV